MDETWVNANHTAPYQWTSPDATKGRKILTGKGQRLILLHAGGSQGFLPGCKLVFRSKSTDGRDYHSEMNAVVFTDWVEKQLLPALTEKTLIVMDNAPYHSVRDQTSVSPTSASRKGVMQEWLRENKIPFDSSLLKPQLYDIIQLHKPPPIYKIDQLIRTHGHEILRLPPYHCDLNPIELIWGDVKGIVGRENSSFKLKDVEKLVNEALDGITQVKWEKCVRKVIEEIEEGYRKKDNLREPIQPVIINLDSDESDVSDIEEF